MTIGARESAPAVEAPPQTQSDGIRPGFLGWQIVGAAFVAHLLANSVTMSAIGNFVLPVSQSFGVPSSTIGYAGSIAILAMGVAGPFLGPWIDRGLARRVMMIGVVSAGSGLLLLSQATTLWQAALAYTLFVCMGAAFFGVMPAMALTASWFVRRRGMAMGIGVAGATLSSYAAPAAAQLLIDEQGWRTAVQVFGIATLVIGLPIFGGLVIGRPEDVGQHPDGDSPVRESAADDRVAHDRERVTPETVTVQTTGELARDMRLWMIAVGFGLVMTSPVVLVVSLVPYGLSLGLTGQEANAFFLAMVPFSLLGKVVIGGLADVAPIKPAILLIVVVNVLVWAIFFFEPSYPLFIVTGAIYGVGIGGAAPVHGVTMGRCFGRSNFGTASGLGGLAAVPLLALVVALSQLMLARTGGYKTGFLVQIGLLLLGGLLLALVKIPSSQDSH